MKLFLQGDFKTNTGPAIANRNLKESLKDCVLVSTSDKQGGIIRVAEIIVKAITADAVILCSFSKSNWITIFISRILRKPVYYYMHGCHKIECEINGTQKKLLIIEEKKMLCFVNKIICVSNLLREKVSLLYPECSKKIIVHYNCFHLDKFVFNSERKDDKKKVILSTGGGMPRKANLIICEAIEKLKEKGNQQFEYIVIGNSYGYEDEFKKYNFVKYYESLSQREIWSLMKKCDVYVQNSRFETFGMAIIEALLNGASILVGSDIGSLEILGQLEENDIIKNNDSRSEIIRKLSYILEHRNAERLYNSMKIEEIDIKKAGEKLMKKVLKKNKFI